MTETTTATSGATPDPGATPGAAQDAAGDSGRTDLGDAGKRALAEVRRELKAKDTQLAERDAHIAELENAGRSELERTRADNERLTETLRQREARIAELERDSARRAAAAAAGIPDQWERLRGETDAELAADAKQLAEWRGATGQTPDLGAGARPGGPATGTSGMSQRIRDRARR